MSDNIDSMMTTAITFNIIFSIMGTIAAFMLGNMVDKITNTQCKLLGAGYTLMLTIIVSIACDINAWWIASIICSFIAILCGMIFTRCIATLVARAYSFTLGGMM